MCFMLKMISEELVWFSFKIETISFSISLLNSKSNSFLPIVSMWNFLSFSNISYHQRCAGQIQCSRWTEQCFLLPITMSYWYQNWVESLDSFNNFVLDSNCLSFASEMAIWYFFLTSTIFRKFAGGFIRLFHLFSGCFNTTIPPTLGPFVWYFC